MSTVLVGLLRQFCEHPVFSAWTCVTHRGRVCERMKLQVNVGKGKVMRCSRYVNVKRMDETK